MLICEELAKNKKINYSRKLISFNFAGKMAPKKVEEPEKKPLIGRVGTNLRVGIVGVPNVGKSTFFNVLTKSAAPAENFPFCTIDPNENKYPNVVVFYCSIYKVKFIQPRKKKLYIRFFLFFF